MTSYKQARVVNVTHESPGGYNVTILNTLIDDFDFPILATGPLPICSVFFLFIQVC